MSRHKGKRRFQFRLKRAAGGRKILAFATLSLLGAALLGLPASAASATQGDDQHKVTICHRTNSTTNPYVKITVDVASVDGDAANDNGQGDHLKEHTGPVWDANTVYPPPHNGDQWGDIIPPLYSDGTPDGLPSLNWNDAGQAIFNNGCNPVTPPPPVKHEVTPPAPSATQPNCTVNTETITHSTTEGVVWSPAGPVTLKPGESVTITATPAEGYVFPVGAQTSWPFTNTFNPATCPKPPVEDDQCPRGTTWTDNNNDGVVQSATECPEVVVPPPHPRPPHHNPPPAHNPPAVAETGHGSTFPWLTAGSFATLLALSGLGLVLRRSRRGQAF